MKGLVLGLGVPALILIALACGGGETPTSTVAPEPTATSAVTPSASPTPSPTREWDLQRIHVDGSTVTAVLRVYAGIDVRVTLDGRDPDQVKGPPPLLQYIFQNVPAGKHAVQVRDVVGHKQSLNVAVPPTKTAPNTISPSE